MIKPFLAAAGCVAVLTLGGCGTPQQTPDPGPTTSEQDGQQANTEPMGDSCNGSFGETDRQGDLTVPANATCELSNVDVTGTVKVETGASLILNNTGVGGNVEGTQFSAITLSGGRIEGNVSLSNGNVVVLENTAVNGNAEFTAVSDQVQLTSNQIGGNLACKDNPAVPAGQDNTVSGQAQDQCQQLGG